MTVFGAVDATVAGVDADPVEDWPDTVAAKVAGLLAADAFDTDKPVALLVVADE